jgi:hypothetical protein
MAFQATVSFVYIGDVPMNLAPEKMLRNARMLLSRRNRK